MQTLNFRNMKKLFFTLILIVSNFLQINAQTQFEVDGVVVPRTIDVNSGKKVQLNGFGTRSKAWVDVYVQALYLTTLSQDAKFILDNETDMAIRIEIVSKLVTTNKFKRAFESGFEKSCGDKIKELESKINTFKTFFDDEIVKGDVFVLSYSPLDNSIYVTKNEKLKGKIEGIDFKLALFGIWLSENPVDKDLKKELLGIQ